MSINTAHLLETTEDDRRLTARIYLGDEVRFGPVIETWISSGKGSPSHLGEHSRIVAKERAKKELQARAAELERIIGWNGVAPQGVMPDLSPEAMAHLFVEWKNRYDLLLEAIAKL